MNVTFAYVTTPDRSEAERIGRALVEKRLAACVNIIEGMTSIYRWEGKIETASETILIVKTTSDHQADIEKEILSLHSYECPCLLFFESSGGFDAYLKWIQASVRAH